jgi:STE24 endopeptidase
MRIGSVVSVLRSLRLPAAIVIALVVAEAAVVLLRPRETRPEPVPVRPRAYFSDAQLARGEAFRSGQRLLMLGSLAVDGAVLVWLVARPPRRLRDRLMRRPVLGAAAAAAGVSLALTVAGLPLSAWSRERARDVGLVTQSWGGWAGDLVKSQAIGTVIAAAGGALLVVGMRRFGRAWWIPGAAVVVAFGAFTLYAGPALLDPLFNRFEPAEPALRAQVQRLAHDAGVKVDKVLVMDASRRTTASNAYVTGLGPTKRVVIYDNLLKDFTPGEVRFVVAHELGHVHYHDVPHGLLYLAIVAPFGMLAVARLAERLGARPDARAVPATALALGLLVPAVTAVSNQLSRAVESRADAFALRATDDPQTQIAFQRRITISNVGDPDPPGWAQALFGTHPTPLERIGAAEAARRRANWTKGTHRRRPFRPPGAAPGRPPTAPS